jgi:DNA-binding winged helix-turn-helix (wHTH) protein
VAELRHGLFTHFLLEALRNHRTLDENGDARISVTEVFERVASGLREYGQQPTILLEGSGDLPVFPVIPLPTKSNPVRRVFPMPVKDPKDFFGRADELKKVQDQLFSTSDILVFVHGEPKIGKTSFLNRVKAALDEDSSPETHFFYFSIEPAEINSVETFAREIWNNLHRICKQHDPTAFQGKTFSFQGYGHFNAELAEALSAFPNFRFVVFLESVQKIKNITTNVDFAQIIGLLRYIIEQTHLPIAFVVSSFQTQEQFFPSGFGSPPSTLDIKLAPLDRGECDEMLAPFFAAEGKEILERIYRLSGGHPYVAKMLAAEIYDALQKSSPAKILENTTWQRLVSEILLSSEADSFFTSLYPRFSDEERYVLMALALRPQYLIQGRELSTWKAIYRSAANRLEKEKSYLLRTPEGGYQLRLQLLGDWLKNWENFPLESERLGLSTLTQTRSVPADGICIDETRGKVYRDGQEVTLSELQYQTLLYLARNMGRVVSREELYEHLHSGNEAYIATDQSLDALVYRLRLALNDREQRYLQTLRKRGYLLEQVAFIPR